MLVKQHQEEIWELTLWLVTSPFHPDGFEPNVWGQRCYLKKKISPDTPGFNKS